jgi:dUTP pyrophosphatase
MLQVKYKKVTTDAIEPKPAHQGDAGLDLFSNENKLIMPNEYCLIKTGIQIELPPNTEGQIRPRSGLALSSGITVLNSPGTIDESYRGE